MSFGIKSNTSCNQACLWMVNHGEAKTQLLPQIQENREEGPYSGKFSIAYACTPCGRRIVGEASRPPLPETRYCPNAAVLWDSFSAPQVLPSLDSERSSTAFGISDDGNTIVGTSAGLPCIWILKKGRWEVQKIGNEEGSAGGITWDGQVVWGSSGRRGFIWTPHKGLQYVSSLLEEQEIQGYENWQFEEVLQVSEDRTMLLCKARRPDGQAFLGRLCLCRAL
jgi:hypothetical protein